MQLPRPYDNRWMIQGTHGLYNGDAQLGLRASQEPEVSRVGVLRAVPEEVRTPVVERAAAGGRGGPHGGTDHLELQEFMRAVRTKTQTPIDVYDSVTMSVIFPLSEESIAKGSAPIPCPDFTRGKWKTRKPAFGTA